MLMTNFFCLNDPGVKGRLLGLKNLLSVLSPTLGALPTSILISSFSESEMVIVEPRLCCDDGPGMPGTNGFGFALELDKVVVEVVMDVTDEAGGGGRISNRFPGSENKEPEAFKPAVRTPDRLGVGMPGMVKAVVGMMFFTSMAGLVIKFELVELEM